MGPKSRQSCCSAPLFRLALRRRGLKALATGILLAQALQAPLASAAPKRAPTPAAPESGVAGGMPAPVVAPIDRLTSALAQIGLTTCSASVIRAARFVFEDGDANFTVQPLGPDANRWPTVITIEGAHAALGKTRFTTVMISPGEGCSGLYEQVIGWPMPCDKLKATVFAMFKDTHIVLKFVQVSELNVGLQLYLTPTPGGCISIKKELFH